MSQDSLTTLTISWSFIKQVTAKLRKRRHHVLVFPAWTTLTLQRNATIEDERRVWAQGLGFHAVCLCESDNGSDSDDITSSHYYFNDIIVSVSAVTSPKSLKSFTLKNHYSGPCWIL